MKIEPDDLAGFQRLWKEQFHLDLSNEEALEKATDLLEMMKVIYRPIPKPIETKQPQLLDFN